MANAYNGAMKKETRSRMAFEAISSGLPFPESHPTFPLWDLGYTPDEVYDLYWPRGFHFCAPPGKPTARGRGAAMKAEPHRQGCAGNPYGVWFGPDGKEEGGELELVEETELS